MKRSIRGHQRIDTIFVLVVFCVFAASVLMVLTLGGSVYQNTIELSHNGYDERTSLSYIWTKVKNSDVNGSIFLDDYGGVTALIFETEWNNRVYRNRVYFYEGWLYEYYSMADFFFGLENGQQIIQTPPITFEDIEDGLIKIIVADNFLYIYPRQ